MITSNPSLIRSSFRNEARPQAQASESIKMWTPPRDAPDVDNKITHETSAMLESMWMDIVSRIDHPRKTLAIEEAKEVAREDQQGTTTQMEGVSQNSSKT